MKEIKTFNELFNLPFGSIVCSELSHRSPMDFSEKEKGFAMVTKEGVEMMGTGLIPRKKGLREKPDVIANFAVKPDHSISTVVTEDNFKTFKLILFEPEDLAEIWKILTGRWASPKNSSKELVRDLFFNVFQFEPGF